MKLLADMDKKEFVYECAARALAASFANPAAKPSIASMVRDASKLWDELKEWEHTEESTS
jgi:membrane-bound inhibitor of C-type lysozyme